MKKGFFIFLTLLMFVVSAVVLSGCGGNNADQATDQTADQTADQAPKAEVLKLGTPYTPIDGKHVIWQIMQFVEEEVEKETNGQFDIELYNSGQLGQERDMIEGVSMGTFKIGCSCGVFGNLSDAFNVFDMPYLFKDLDHYARVCRSDIAKDIGKTLEKENLVVLGTGLGGGIYHIFNSKRPVKTPADMKGLKIRTMDSPIILETMNTLGATAIPMAWGEVYTALQQKTIDGVFTVNPGTLGTKQYECEPYGSQVSMIYSPQLVYVNKQWWEGLPEEARKAFQKGVDQAMERSYEDMKLQEQQMVENLEKTGKIDILDYDEIDSEAFRKAVQPVYDKYGEKYKEWIDRIKAME